MTSCTTPENWRVPGMRQELHVINMKVVSWLCVCFFKERAAQARITDLEAQLSRATASAAQMKKSKDEVIEHF